MPTAPQPRLHRSPDWPSGRRWADRLAPQRDWSSVAWSESEWNSSGLTMNDPIVEFEQRTQPFLEAAFTSMGVGSGQAEQLSHRFRDVNDDLVGVGPVLIGLAGQMGVPPADMVRWAGTLSDREVHDLAKQLLRVDHEGERLWEQTQRPPGEGRDPRDPMGIGLDQEALGLVSAELRRTHPDGPWSQHCDGS